MSLPGAQSKALHDALLQEFPDPELLKHWVRWGLDWNLPAVANTNNLSNSVFDLIERADADGRMPDLLDAAIRAAPQNTTLREIAAELSLAIDVPLDAPSTLPPLRPAVVLSPDEQRNRRIMISRVRNTWIAGVLEQSLYAATRIELGLQTDPMSVADPWRLVRESPGRPAEMLPPDTSINQVYNRIDGSLLILGGPGAGKTNLLLELARSGLDRAEHDLAEPIPVVFHLSAWAATARPLTEWLVAELREKYYVQEKVGRPWVENDQLLVLLDGPDEVAPAHRTACVQAINAYRQKHGLALLVVCSREAEYLALSTALAVTQAVVVQPLTPAQVTAYLKKGGAAAAAVWTALDTNSEQHTLLYTPLMLNVLVMTYHDVPLANLRRLGMPTTFQQLWEAYVQRMLSRRPATVLYKPQRTLHWLGWLAQQMASHNQTVFYIERLQPDWRPPFAQTAYRWLMVLAVGLVYGLVGGLGGGLFLGLFVGLALGAIGGPVAGLSGGLGLGLVAVPSVGLLVGLVAGLVVRLRVAIPIMPAEIMTWSWMGMRRGLRANRFRWLFAGLGGGLLGAFTGQRGVSSVLIWALFWTLVAALVIGMFFGLEGGFSTDLLHDQSRNRPNQGIWQSARNGLFRGMVFGLVYGFVTWLIVGLVGALEFGMVFGLESGLNIWLNSMGGSGLLFGLSGLFLGLIVGLGGGWNACIAHFVLRFVLWLAGALPLNLGRFLDYTTERILLRKVGGGYIFIHRLLLEYFAEHAPYIPPMPRAPAGAAGVSTAKD